jgi:hypothetical protein
MADFSKPGLLSKKLKIQANIFLPHIMSIISSTIIKGNSQIAKIFYKKNRLHLDAH